MTNLRIGIGLSFYQDFDSLNRMLQSLQQYPIDHIIAVDGKYKGHTAKQALSDDSVRDLFKSFQIPYSLYDDGANLSQIDKRQIYFDKAQTLRLDIIIVMDSDEYIVHNKTNWTLFIDELEGHISMNKSTYIQGYTIPLCINHKRYAKVPDYTINSARVFHRPSELVYVDNHFTIRNKKSGINMGYQTHATKLNNLFLATDHKLRDKDYMEQHDLYEDYQVTTEETPEAIRSRVDAFIKQRESLQVEQHV